MLFLLARSDVKLRGPHVRPLKALAEDAPDTRTIRSQTAKCRALGECGCRGQLQTELRSRAGAGAH